MYATLVPPAAPFWHVGWSPPFPPSPLRDDDELEDMSQHRRRSIEGPFFRDGGHHRSRGRSDCARPYRLEVEEAFAGISGREGDGSPNQDAREGQSVRRGNLLHVSLCRACGTAIGQTTGLHPPPSAIGLPAIVGLGQ